MISETETEYAKRKRAAAARFYASNRTKVCEKKRAARKAKPVDPDEVVLAPKMLETEFWDETTAPLLALFKAGPMSWADIEAGVALLEMNPRFMHHAVAYLEQKGRIHHEGMTDVVWYYGPRLMSI